MKHSETCPKCGIPLLEGSTYCRGCGIKLNGPSFGASRATSSSRAKRKLLPDHSIGYIICTLTPIILVVLLYVVNGIITYKPAPKPLPGYTVTLNPTGGTGGTSSVRVEYGSAMPSATAPTKSGYRFKGYCLYKKGQGPKYYDENMKSVRNWDKTNDVILYAYWEKK